MKKNYKDLKMVIYFENVNDYDRDRVIKAVQNIENLPFTYNCSVWEHEEF